jgi:hypothetical protein
MRGRKPIPTDILKLMGTFNTTIHGRDRKGEPKPVLSAFAPAGSRIGGRLGHG